MCETPAGLPAFLQSAIGSRLQGLAAQVAAAAASPQRKRFDLPDGMPEQCAAAGFVVHSNGAFAEVPTRCARCHPPAMTWNGSPGAVPSSPLNELPAC